MKKQLKMILMVGLIISILFSINLAVFADDLGSWTTNTVQMKIASSLFGVAAIDNYIYVVGGSVDNYNWRTTLQVYNQTTNTWEYKANMAKGRQDLCSVALNGKIYALGGLNSTSLNSVEEYDPVTNTWVSKANMLTARQDFAAATCNGKIYVFGGSNGSNAYLNSVEEYDPTTDTWIAKANMLNGRKLMGAAEVNGEIYVIGGFANNSMSKAVEAYDPETDTWTTKENMPTERDYLGVAALNGRIYATGGENGNGMIDTVEVYNPSTNKWTTVASLNNTRALHGAVVANGKLYVIGGGTQHSSSHLGTVEELTPPIYPVTAPTNLIATAGDSKVDLSWTAVDGATSYNVKRATTAGGPYETIASNITGATYNDNGLTNGTTYYYVVTAVNSAEESNPSNEASATPFKPVVKPDPATNLVATGGDKKVDLTWNATEGASTYTVKRSTTAGGPYTVIAENLAATNYSDTGVTNGTTYYYIVTASNAEGESDQSNEASATPTDTQQPTQNGDRAILVVTMTNGTIAEYDLSMTEVNAFVKWYSDKADGSGKAVYTINKNSNLAPFLSRKDYLNFDKIYSFEVKEYK